MTTDMLTTNTNMLPRPRSIDWVRCLPFFALHVACLAVFWVGWSWTAVLTALSLYVVRAFGLTAFYHRYFAHRAFKTSRPFQFVGACLGVAAIQRGPIWWAAHHRAHHRHSDTEQDAHSPVAHGFWWSHVGWFMTRENYATRTALVKDLWRYPELRFINRFDLLVPLALGVLLYGLGELLRSWAPGLQTSGWQLFVWGFIISTVLLYHATFCINSLCHRVGYRSYPTKDDSRNNWVLALLTLGEGWHNNHHYYPSSARNGFRWWELDVTYYVLVVLSWVGLVWDLRPLPERVLQEQRPGAG